MLNIKRISFFDYYFYSWICVFFFSFSLLTFSGLLELWLSAVLFLVSGYLVSARFYKQASLSWLKVLGLVLIALVFLLRAYYIFYTSAGKVSFITSVLLAFLPIFLARKQKVFGVWVAFFVLALLSLVSLVVHNKAVSFIFLISLLFSLIFHMNAANLFVLVGLQKSHFQFLPRGHFKQFGHSILWGGVAAAVIFMAFPRTTSLQNPFGIREKGESSGYSGSVNLKNKSEINVSTSLAMIVEAKDKEWLKERGEELYFRGNTLDFFDGKNWGTKFPGTWKYETGIDMRQARWYEYPPKFLKVFREPHATRAVLIPGILLQLDVPQEVVGGLAIDKNKNIYRNNSEIIRYSYEVLVGIPKEGNSLKDLPLSSFKAQLNEKELNEGLSSYGQKIPISYYLEMPKDFDFFNEWVGKIESVKEGSSLLQVGNALKVYFQRHYTPALQYEFTGDDAFRSFLLKDKKGHCEYFATAAALYFRSLGIPSRLVLGYRGGSFNQISGVLEVREAQAHAWVEIYQPGMGWVVFDGTPILQEEGMSTLQAYFTLYSGAVKFWTQRYIVDYNSLTQIALAKKVVGIGKDNSIFKFNFKSFDWKNVLALFAVLVTGLYFYRKKKQKEQKLLYPSYYYYFLAKLNKRKIVKHPSETYSSFHHRLINLGLPLQTVSKVNQCLERDLYSSQSSDSTIVKSLKKEIRRSL